MPEWKLFILLDVLSWVIYLVIAPLIFTPIVEYICYLCRPKETRTGFKIKELYYVLFLRDGEGLGIFRLLFYPLNALNYLLVILVFLVVSTATIDIVCSFFESKYKKYCHATSSTFEFLYSLPNEYGLRALYALLF